MAPQQQLPQAVSADVAALFGTIVNARDRLLLHDVPYHSVRRALRGEDVDPEVVARLLGAWDRWCLQYLHGAAAGREAGDWTLLDTRAERYRTMRRPPAICGTGSGISGPSSGTMAPCRRRPGRG